MNFMTQLVQKKKQKRRTFLTVHEALRSLQFALEDGTPWLLTNADDSTTNAGFVQARVRAGW
jgi:hypothetical protein